MEYVGLISEENALAHYGVLGMKWGVRRYQPYSYTGSRKGGKTGKEIGEALKKSHRTLSEMAADRAKAKDYARRAAKSKATREAKAQEAARQQKEVEKRQRIEEKKQTKIESNKMVGYKRKEVKNLSDEEIRARIARLQLEKEYKDASKVDRTEGKEFIKKVLTESGQKILTDVATNTGKLLIANIIDNASGVPGLGAQATGGTKSASQLVQEQIKQQQQKKQQAQQQKKKQQ